MTIYIVRQHRGLEVDDRDPENRIGRPKLVELGTFEAHGPEAACLIAGEENPDCVNVDFGFDLEAVPVRNRHRVTLRPKSGYELAPADEEPPTSEEPAGEQATAEMAIETPDGERI